MKSGSLEAQFESDGPSSAAVESEAIWDQYEIIAVAADSNPDCYDGVALAIQRSWFGIVLAGAIVAVVLFLIVLVERSINAYVSPIQWTISLPMGAVVFAIGGLLAGFWSVFAIFFVMLLNFAFWEMFNRRTAVAICGGGSGFVASYWPHFSYANVATDMIPYYLALVIFAMAMCQFGALWWGARELAFLVPDKGDSKSVHGFQFKITHIMIAMVWFAVLCAIDGLSPRHEVLVMAGIYATVQAVLLLIDWAIFRRKKTAPKLAEKVQA